MQATQEVEFKVGDKAVYPAQGVAEVISIDEKLFPRYRRGTDFIQRYIFPGGMLPSPERIRGLAEGAALALKAFENVLDVYPMNRSAQEEVGTLSDELAGEAI